MYIYISWNPTKGALGPPAFFCRGGGTSKQNTVILLRLFLPVVKFSEVSVESARRTTAGLYCPPPPQHVGRPHHTAAVMKEHRPNVPLCETAFGPSHMWAAGGTAAAEASHTKASLCRGIKNPRRFSGTQLFPKRVHFSTEESSGPGCGKVIKPIGRNWFIGASPA